MKTNTQQTIIYTDVLAKIFALDYSQPTGKLANLVKIPASK